MLIGISGPSCSGKTSLAREIGALLGAPTFHLDEYYIPGSERPLVAGHPSFERPHQYDGKALLKDVRRALGASQIVIVEGFLLFSYPGFEMECYRMVHLDVPHAVLAARRKARLETAQDASDIKGGRKAETDIGWNAHGQLEWERWGAFQADIPGIQVIRPCDMDPQSSSPEQIARMLVDSWAMAEAN